MSRRSSPFAAALAAGPLLLDGGLATRLEARGHDLSDTLWSARLLLTEPEAVRAAHADFFAAGAAVAITASYQVSELGFAAAGRPVEEVAVALRRSVTLAREAAQATGAGAGGPSVRFVAASVGPYGAALADGSEYRGDYGLSVAQLRAWHRPRLQVLADAGADVLALETIPSLAEAEALLAEVAQLGVPAWLSMTADGERTRLGEPLREAYAMAADVANVVAVGANCYAPEQTGQVLAAVAAGAPELPPVVYPNSGERWDASARRWTGAPTIGAAAAREWVAGGARLVGGCCRVSPRLIADMHSGLASAR
ncbi:homocysteine S-methyltransferase [Kineosphaera limosa]|uniref:Homocysteine S-methyltransferase n=1 Tax=Kineosphaera limosa NBRC 100340 TaxID=1184609 RepID=K6WNR4_9MICO|nr:homocysteine S-methyltransferase [Kineosphaera limosa]NYE01376.1 homocysteine S-methyltransferase [Kineosphaera limosa]GAB95451.1 homocysteine S-methyltransferase [Kineosphaera limosa NBRC 100340]